MEIREITGDKRRYLPLLGVVVRTQTAEETE